MNYITLHTPKGKRKIGPGEPVFIVAELSGNHGQNFEKAVHLIRAAAEAGVDAVKIQTYTADTMTINSQKEWFLVGGKDNPGSWQGKTLYELYQHAYTPWDWHPKLRKIAEDLGIVFFSTAFDETSVDFLEQMDVPCYKVASYEVNDIPLLKKIAKTGKPVLISLGYATQDEAELAIDTLRENGAKEIGVLHCVTGYSDRPNPELINLKTMDDICRRFQAVAGFSDNNAGIDIPITAAALGANIIEKHFILNGDESYDARFSITPREMEEMVQTIRNNPSIRVPAAVGRVHYGPTGPIEEYNRRWRRSLFVVQDVKQGEVFSRQNVRSIRPAFGMHTRHFDAVLGKKAALSIEAGTPLSEELVSNN